MEHIVIQHHWHGAILLLVLLNAELMIWNYVFKDYGFYRIRLRPVETLAIAIHLMVHNANYFKEDLIVKLEILLVTIYVNISMIQLHNNIVHNWIASIYACRMIYWIASLIFNPIVSIQINLKTLIAKYSIRNNFV